MVELCILTLVFFPFFWAALLVVIPSKLRSLFGIFSSINALALTAVVIYLSQYQIEMSYPRIFIPWFPQAYVNLSFLADGWALFFSLLITAMGTLVFLYSHFYMDHSELKIRNFYCYLNVFMGAMLGTVLADNFMLLFLFWELTGITSYLLIGYENNHEEARRASRSAFLITSLAGLLLFLGLILIGILDQTLEISEVTNKGIILGNHPSWIFSVILLILIGVYGKSAQFPLHFWLPEAMAAPTPVSAYLHSATMVKLGIYLVGRIYVIFATSELWFPIVTSMSLVTILVGGVAALFAVKLKRILAFATVSQLGFFISFYGIADPEGLVYDYVHIFNHALYKGGLFMLVGVLAHVAGIKEIRQLGGLIKKMPLWSVAFLISVAAMAGIPGTTGFVSKELLLKDILVLAQQEWVGIFIFVVLFFGLLFKVAFSFRLLYHLLFGDTEPSVKIDRGYNKLILLPPYILSISSLILGIWPSGLERLSKVYTIKGLHAEDLEKLSLWHGMTLNLVLSLALFGGGIVLFYLTRPRERFYRSLPLPDFAYGWNCLIHALPTVAEKITKRVHNVNPQINLTWVFLIFFGLIGGEFWGQEVLLDLKIELSTLALVQILIIVFTGMILIMKGPINRLLALSMVGFLVTYYFVIKRAPDLAMTQMVVEVSILFVFVIVCYKLGANTRSSFSIIRLMIAAGVGCVVALIPIFNGAMLTPNMLGIFFIENATLLAKGTNVVNTILVDFRALDTFGEVCVIVVAMLTVSLMNKRSWNALCTLKKPFIPTPVLPSIMPLILFIAGIFSFYLLVRGHNQPGGGFIGGMVIAVSLILGVIAARTASRFPFYVDWSPITTAMTGLALICVAAVIPILLGDVFLESYFVNKTTLISTPFLFDFGVFTLVMGGVFGILLTLRKNTVEDR